MHCTGGEGDADNTGQRQTQDRVTRPDGRQRTVREALGTSEVRGCVQEGTPRPRPAQHLALEQSPCPRVPWARQQAAGQPLVLKDRGWSGGKLRLSHHVGGACSILGLQDLLSMQCLSCPFVHMGAEFPGQPRPRTPASRTAPTPYAAPGQGAPSSRLLQDRYIANSPKTWWLKQRGVRLGVRMGSPFLSGGFWWAVPRPRQA